MELSDFLPVPTVRVELTEEEIDLLVHFATLGQNVCQVRNNHGDRSVAALLDPVLSKLNLSRFGG